MRPASQPPSSTLDRPRVQPTRSAAQPAFILDVAAACLLGANPAGWQVWGLNAATVVPPVPIDGAMPALQRLRERARAHAGAEMLTFWTPRGLVRFACRVERGEGAAGTIATVTVIGGRPAQPAADLPRKVAPTAWLAHELRTPLSAVIAYAEVLKSEHFGPLANPRYRDYARDIYESARHALSVVDRLLRGEPAPSIVPPLAFGDLDPAAVVESCLAVARPLATRAGLELGASFGPSLPRIVADELSLKQMLLNLLANAIKFARPGDRVTVTVACDGTGPLTIAVADTGPGMDAGTAPGDPRPNGTGLGLPITRALAAANGADLAIDSAPGAGTRVTLTFAPDRAVPV